MIISSLTSVKVFDIGIVPGFQIALITAEGTVPTSGWTHPRLVPFVAGSRPSDQIFDIDFVADEPSGMVLDVILPVSAQVVIRLPDGTKGVRVHAKAGFLEDVFKTHSHSYYPSYLSILNPASSGNIALMQSASVIYRQELTHYEDSHQPTGTIHWKNDGPFGTPNPHAEMKKLVHILTLTINGPDEGTIRKCVSDALAQGLLTALIAAFLTAGIGAVQAFVATVTGSLTACIGGGTIRFDDDSHWEYWDL